MKRLINIVLLLFLSICISGQVVTTNVYFAPAADYNAEYDTVLAAMTTKPTGDTLTWQNSMVNSLDSAGLWDRCKLFYVFASTINTGNEALINWITPGTYDADDPTTTAWTKRRGYNGDGSSDYISTNFTPSTAGVAQDSASFGIYILDDIQEDKEVCGRDATADTYFRPRSTTNQSTVRINASTSQTYTGATTSVGFWIISRTVSSYSELYLNGTSIDTEADASSAVTAGEILILDDGGGAYSDHEVALFFYGDGFTDTDASTMNKFVKKYLAHFGL